MHARMLKKSQCRYDSSSVRPVAKRNSERKKGEQIVPKVRRETRCLSTHMCSNTMSFSRFLNSKG